MTTAEELLCDRKWRLRNSTWMLWGILTASMLGFVGWGYIGLKARNKRWLLISAALLVWTIGYAIVAANLALPGKGEQMTSSQQSQSSALGSVILAVWVASGVYGWFENRKWLVFKAKQGEPAPWFATATATGTEDKPVGADVSSALASALSSAEPDLDTVAPEMITQPDARVDINSASREQLLRLPGVDFQMVDRILSARAQLGGFTTLTDLVTQASVPPHVFAGFQEKILATPPVRPSATPDGRRLEF